MRIDDLPGELLIWVLIASELLVFAAGVTAITAVRLTDPVAFAADQAHLDGRLAALNTLVLVTSGLFAARAERAAAKEDRRAARRGLALAALGGVVFLAVKLAEYASHASAGIGIESSAFFTFYYLLTGFHAAHVLAGIVVLALVGWRARAAGVQVDAAFWHMVDLIWVLILPPIYLMGAAWTG